MRDRDRSSGSTAHLARVHLVRVAQPREPAPSAPTGTPWSRGLWGVFMPDRRATSVPVAVDRRA